VPGLPGVRPAEAPNAARARGASGRRPGHARLRGVGPAGAPREGTCRVKKATPYKKDARRLGKRKARARKLAAKRHRSRFRPPGQLRRRGILYVM
jgi:hypothetical protein